MVVDVDTGQNFRFPVNESVTMLSVLCETGVTPFTGLGGFFMFQSTRINAAAHFTNVNCIGAALTVELVNAFTFTRGRLGFVARAEDTY